MKNIKITTETFDLISKAASAASLSPTMYIETIVKAMIIDRDKDEEIMVNFTGLLKKRLVQAVNYKLLYVEVSEETKANFFDIVEAWFQNQALKVWFLDMLKSTGKQFFLSERGSKFSIDVESCKMARNWNEKIRIKHNEKVLKGE